MPLRTCICCGQKGPKEGLLRLVYDGKGSVEADPLYKKPGRGAYVCAREGCVEGLLRHKKLSSVFRVSTRCSAGREAVEALVALIEKRFQAKA